MKYKIKNQTILHIIHLSLSSVHLLVHIHNCKDIVALIANSTGIPHLQYDWNIETTIEQLQLNHRMSVNVAPTLTAISKAYWDIIKINYDWKTFTIFYQSEQGAGTIYEIFFE